ncbi:unnamed protein product, partial [Prorocentrum cordatum]
QPLWPCRGATGAAAEAAIWRPPAPAARAPEGSARWRPRCTRLRTVRPSSSPARSSRPSCSAPPRPRSGAPATTSCENSWGTSDRRVADLHPGRLDRGRGMVAGVVVARRGLHRGGLAGGGAPRQPRRFAGGAGAGHGALLAWPFCGIIGAPLGLKPLGGPSFDPALLPLEQAALYEASAAFLLNLAVLSLNHAERLVPLRRFYLLKAGLTAAVIRVMLQGRGDRGRRPTLWSTTPATGAPPSAAPSQRPACSRTAPGAPSSGPRLGPRALPARSGSPSSSDPRGGAAAVARRVGAAATPARPLSDIRRPLEASCFVFHPASG